MRPQENWVLQAFFKSDFKPDTPVVTWEIIFVLLYLPSLLKTLVSHVTKHNVVHKYKDFIIIKNTSCLPLERLDKDWRV